MSMEKKRDAHLSDIASPLVTIGFAIRGAPDFSLLAITKCPLETGSPGHASTLHADTLGDVERSVRA